jgi:hypothetical protein
MKRYIIFFDEDKVSINRPEFYCGWPVNDLAFICPECLDVWATIEAEGDRPYQIQVISCENHLSTHWILNPIPGSILDNSMFSNGPDWDLLAALPIELLRREYNLHIKQFERYQNEQSSTETSRSPGRVIVASWGERST